MKRYPIGQRIEVIAARKDGQCTMQQYIGARGVVVGYTSFWQRFRQCRPKTRLWRESIYFLELDVEPGTYFTSPHWTLRPLDDDDKKNGLTVLRELGYRPPAKRVQVNPKETV